MDLPGTEKIVENVPRAFARLVSETAPRSIALSGGGTAEQCYRQLRNEPLDWGRVEVFFGDDRKVPVDHPDSNEGMARRVLLDHVGPHAIHSMHELGADRYDALVRAAPPIGIVHLGLGPDGHTASLFPGTAVLEVQERLVVENEDQLHPHPRITFTFPGIARAELAVITVAGVEKRAAVARIRAGEDLPGARIRAQQVLWLGDAAALA